MPLMGHRNGVYVAAAADTLADKTTRKERWLENRALL